MDRDSNPVLSAILLERIRLENMDNIDKQIRLCGYSFQFIQQLIPDCQNGTVIKLYFLETDEYKKVECELLDRVNTKYNKKNN